MKKTLFIFLAFLTCLSAFSQRTRIINGYDPITGRGGYKYFDTAKTPKAQHPLQYDGDSTFSFDSAAYYISSFASNTTSDSVILTMMNGRRLAAKAAGLGGGGGSSQWVTTGNDIYYNVGSAAIGTTTPNINSVLDLTSTTKGFLLPRLTTTQRDAIVSPPYGLQVFNSTTNTIDIYIVTGWVTISSSANTVLTTGDQSVSGIKTFNGNFNGAAIQINNNGAIRGTSSTGGNLYIDANQAIDNTGTINLRGNVAITGATTFSSTLSATQFTATAAGASYTVANNGAIRGSGASNGTLYMDVSQDFTGTYNFRATTVNLPNTVATKYSVSALNAAPASATATGTAGEIRFTSSGIYLCIATNSWLKFTGATF